MIVIEKRTIKVSLDELRDEIKELCRLTKKHNPSIIGIGYKTLNKHFKVKLTNTDFYVLSEQLKYKVSRGEYWYFDNNPELKEALA